MPGITTVQDTQTRERAGQAKDVAVERSGQVASTAKEQAATVADETKAQAASLAGQVRDNVREQSMTQRDRLTGTLHTFAADLDRMAAGADSAGPASTLVRRLSDQAHDLASSLDDRDPADLVAGVQDFARRRPGAFLTGAAIAGVLAGRAMRGARDARRMSDDSLTTTGTSTTAWTGTPSTVGASATPIGDEAQAAVGAYEPDYTPSPVGGDTMRAVDLREVTGERALAPVPENSPDDGFGEALEPDRGGQRSME